jgi:hypothetical protein
MSLKKNSALHLIIHVDEALGLRVIPVLGSPARLAWPITTIDHGMVILHWRPDLPADPDIQKMGEQVAAHYARRRAEETAYQGPIDCCL